MKKTKSILWGIVLVVFGALFALKSLNVLSFDIFFDGWWTLFIIVPSVIGLFTERDKTGEIIALAIGVFLLLGCRDIVSFGTIWKLIVPVVIVVIGVKMILGGLTGKKVSREIEVINTDEAKHRNSFAAFSGNDMKVDGEVFEGAELTAVFGGVKCDLRNAIIEKDCVIKVSAVFGGIDILVSDNVNVKTNSISLFGGMSNKTSAKGNCPTVYVSGTCLFGGVDIK